MVPHSKDTQGRERTQLRMREFHMRFRPFVRRIYRAGLVLTGSPSCSEALQTAIYLEAFERYPAGGVHDFRKWLSPIVKDVFDRHRREHTRPVDAAPLPREGMAGSEEDDHKSLQLPFPCCRLSQPDPATRTGKASIHLNAEALNSQRYG